MSAAAAATQALTTRRIRRVRRIVAGHGGVPQHHQHRWLGDADGSMTPTNRPTSMMPMISSMTYFPSGQPQTMTTDTGAATITGTWGLTTGSA